MMLKQSLSSPVVALTPSPKPTFKSKYLAKSQPSLNLLSPVGGESVVYNQPFDITWNSKGMTQINISLLLNDTVLGSIASSSATLGKLTIKPSDYITPTFLTSINSFKVKVSDPVSGISDISQGPFAIVSSDSYPQDATQAASLASRGGDANDDGTIDLFDVSKLLSSFGTAKDSNFGLDLNGDQAVNDVDFYLLRNLMIQKGLIQ
jgi:hypothetical protein